MIKARKTPNVVAQGLVEAKRDASIQSEFADDKSILCLLRLSVAQCYQCDEKTIGKV